MKIKSEIIVILLFILFSILIFGYPLTGNNIYNEIFAVGIFYIIPLIIIACLAYLLIKNNSEIMEQLKNTHIIIKILIGLCVICFIYDCFNIGNGQFISSIALLVLIIVEFGFWFFKKEE
ncbi:hypothetical protein [Methanobrevibacter sp.]